MAKTIDTLVDDIKGVLGKGTTVLNEDVLAKYGSSVALHVADALRQRTGKRKPNTLYMSEIGKPCVRQIWYGIHLPELAEPMQEHTLFKFVYGDVIEETTLLLAEAAGHTVELRQHRVSYRHGDWFVDGRIDAVIDGVLVDVKSCSPFGFKKFKEGLTDDNDGFGYRDQLSGYNVGHHYSKQGFLAVDKQNGHIGYFDSEWRDIKPRIHDVVASVDNPCVEPPRRFKLIPMGTSGNKRLGVECSYCPFKAACWRDANHGEGLKAYGYASGPVFLGTLSKEPNVPEIPMPNITDIESTIALHAVANDPDAKRIATRWSVEDEATDTVA